ncbi:MAG: ParB/RepB/Spo0J family partition protein [Myxococcaceae bacterium]|nr:MAG: ParB/RepB/Spo0J family partition protein [Myxococcaceae bacterium]
MDGIDPKTTNDLTTRDVPIGLIIPRKQPRTTFDEVSLRELATSLASPVGQIHPLLVRPVGDLFEIVAGERRWRAAGLAGLATLRCEVREIPDDLVREMQLVENAGREDVHPLEEAIALEAIIREDKRTPEYLADRLGHSVRWVQRRLALLGLTEQGREWLRDGRLPIAHAQQLAAVDAATQARVLARYTGPHASGLPSSRDFARTIGFELHQLDVAPFDPTDAKLPGHGVCGKCVHRSDTQGDLFVGAAAGAMCLDAACWDGKVAAVWERAVKAAPKKHLTVIAEPGDAFGYGDQLRWDSDLQKTPASEGAKPVAVARTASGHVVELYAKPKPAARDAGDDDENEGADGEGSPRGPDKWELKRQAEAVEARVRAERMLALSETRAGLVPMLRTALHACLVNFGGRTFPAVLKALGGDPSEDLSDDALVDALPEDVLVRALAATVALEALEYDADEGEERPTFEAELIEMMKGESPAAPAVDALVELVAPQHWVPEADVEVLDPKTAVLWTPTAEDGETLRTVLPESMAHEIEEHGVPFTRRTPTAPSHVVRVGTSVPYLLGTRSEAVVVGFVREDGPSGTVLLIDGGQHRVAWSDTVEALTGALLFRPEGQGGRIEPGADGYWTVSKAVAKPSPSKPAKKTAAPVESDASTTELRVKRGDWLQHRSGLRDTAKAALHKQWEPDGDDRVCRVERGAAVLSQVTDYCREHKVPLVVNGKALVEPAVPVPAAKAKKAPAAPVQTPAPRIERVADDVLAVLSTMGVDGTVARIVEGNLPRPLYERVDRTLQALGGTWSKKLKGHVFADDPRDALDGVILTGEVAHARDVLGWFPTPMELVKELLDLAEGTAGMTLLEPSAGEGAIVGAALMRDYAVTAVELDKGRHRTLVSRYLSSGRRPDGSRDGIEADVCGDFLRYDPEQRFDRVVMNPPFARQQDIDHVTAAFRLLKPGGRLVAVMSAGIAFREDRKTVAFRELVREAGGRVTENPEGSFKSSGTSVRTVTVVMDRKAVSP